MTVRSAMGPASDRREHELRALVAAARWGAADPEVVEAIAARVPDGDGGAWVQEWTAGGGAAWAAARRGRALRAYLHAASYYAAALALIDESDGLVEEERLWERQRECWDRAVGLLGGERLSIAYEHTTLPGYFFSGGPGARPLVVVDHGGRVATSVAWAAGGAAAAARGYHWMTFDGPGRQAALRRQGLVLRPDWEAVLGPVADAMARPCGCRRVADGGDRDRPRRVRGRARAGVRARASPRRCWRPGSSTRRGLGWTRCRRRPGRQCWTRTANGSIVSFIWRRCSHPEIPERLRRLGREYDLSGLPLYDLARRIGEFRLGEELRRITHAGARLPRARGPSRCGRSRPRSCARELPGAELARARAGRRRASRTGSTGSCNPDRRGL